MEVPSDALWRISTRANKPQNAEARLVARTVLAPDAAQFGHRARLSLAAGSAGLARNGLNC